MHRLFQCCTTSEPIAETRPLRNIPDLRTGHAVWAGFCTHLGSNISDNVTSLDGNGAGIYLWIGGAPLIQNNIIARNQAGSSGGAITMQNSGEKLDKMEIFRRTPSS
jgi:parallel beta-helix repeat protein